MKLLYCFIVLLLISCSYPSREEQLMDYFNPIVETESVSAQHWIAYISKTEYWEITKIKNGNPDSIRVYDIDLMIMMQSTNKKLNYFAKELKRLEEQLKR